MDRPTRLRTTNLPPPSSPSAATLSNTSIEASADISPCFAPLHTRRFSSTPAASTSVSRSTHTATTSRNSSTTSSLSTTDTDSLWSTSLSRYSFCSVNTYSQLPSRIRRPREEREKGSKPRIRRSNTTMTCGRHGDEWLFGNWRGIVRSILS